MSFLGPLPDRASVLQPRGFEAAAINSCYLAGDGAAMRRVRSQLERIAPYFRVALITGEMGTGKETVARALHARSPGADGPFVVWEAERFAEKLQDESQVGPLLREALGGTIFLREVCTVPHALQPLLLRLLRQQEQRSQRGDVRIVAASERDLRTLTTMGQFRDELYRQIAAVEIGLTPLRKRAEDIAEVVATLARQNGAAGIAPEAVARMEQYAWPGNVSEAREVMERAAALAEGGMVEVRHLSLAEPGETSVAETADKNLEKLQDVVQRHVLEVLSQCAGNKLRASEVLGISRSTLYRMLDACAPDSDAGLSR